MIGKYASILATDKDGDTPLHIAAAGGHDECVEAFAKECSRKNSITFCNSKRKFRIFIEHVSAFATTKDGDTPLHIAAAPRARGVCSMYCLACGSSEVNYIFCTGAGITELHMHYNQASSIHLPCTVVM